MRKKKTKPVKKNNLKLLGIFMLLVFVLLFLSGCVKLAAIIAKSKFDGYHRFTIEAFYSPKEVTFISVSPQDNSASVLHVTANNSFSPGESLAVPTDGLLSHPTFPSTTQNTETVFQAIILHAHDAGITVVDALRLYLISRAVSVTKNEEIQLPMDDSNIDAQVSRLFRDPSISDENTTIEIVNATNISGLGTRLARLLSNLGANVITVRSADETSRSSISYAGSSSYTLTKLQSLLHLPAKPMKNNGLSDIIIIIGDDASHPTLY